MAESSTASFSLSMGGLRARITEIEGVAWVSECSMADQSGRYNFTSVVRSLRDVCDHWQGVVAQF